MIKVGFKGVVLEFSKAPTAKEIQLAYKIKQSVRKEPQFKALSKTQEAIWFSSKVLEQETEDASYNISFEIQLKGELSEDLFWQALENLFRRHTILRSQFTEVQAAPTYRICDQVNVRRDQCELQFDDQQLALEHVKADFARHRISIYDYPLVKVKLVKLRENQYLVLAMVHHIIFDGESIEIFVRDLLECYELLKNADEPSENLDQKYLDSFSEHTHVQNTNKETAESLWIESLREIDTGIELPRQVSPEQASYRAAKVTRILSEGAIETVASVAKASKVTKFSVLLMLYHLVLYTYSRQETIAIGLPLSTRTRNDKGLIGFYINSLPVCISFSDQHSVREALSLIKDTVFELYKKRQYPFVQLVEIISPERSQKLNPLFQVAMTYQHSPLPAEQNATFEFDTCILDNASVTADILLDINQNGDSLIIEWIYKQELFDKALVDAMADRFNAFLTQIPVHLESNLKDFFTHSTKFDVPYASAYGVKLEVPSVTLHSLIQERAIKTPDALAVRDEYETVSYDELEARANSIANELTALGVQEGSLVGVHIERSTHLITAIVGILKTGAAYLPLDPDYPSERLKFMIQDSKVQVIVGKRPVGLDIKDLLVLDIKNIDFSSKGIVPSIMRGGSQSLAYVIYTSGSTGKPKGIQVNHSNVINRIYGMISEYNYCEADRLLQFVSVSFDVFAEEMFSSLLSGACLVMHSQLRGLNYAEFISFCNKQQVTVLHIPPTFLSALVDELELGNVSYSNTMRMLITGGEQPPLATLKKWMLLVGEDCSVINAYGPSEATMATCTFNCLEISSKFSTSIVPIGKPLANTYIRLLDKELRPVPQGVTGEIFIGGAGLSPGYINRPDLTEERFLKDPYALSDSMLYKTGDFGRFLPDGNLMFSGRDDDQVKIQGHRIELAEVEATLLAHPLVSEAAVVVSRHEQQTKVSLTAFVRIDEDKLKRSKVYQQFRHGVETQAVRNWRQHFTHDLQSQTFGELLYSRGYTQQASNTIRERKSRPSPWEHLALEKIRELRPDFVLEFFPKTTLFSTELAPVCKKYVFVGNDYCTFDEKSGDNVYSYVSEAVQDLYSEGVSAGSKIVILFNSVTQYFPNTSFLLSTLRSICENLTNVEVEATIAFLDVRNYDLIRHEHLSQILEEVSSDTKKQVLKSILTKRMLADRQLSISPRFFRELKKIFLEISSVVLEPRTYELEHPFSLYRYDAFINFYTRNIEAVPTDALYVNSETFSNYLLNTQQKSVSIKPMYVRGLRDSRLSVISSILRVIDAEGEENTLSELKIRADAQQLPAYDPGLIKASVKSAQTQFRWFTDESCEHFDLLINNDSGLNMNVALNFDPPDSLFIDYLHSLTSYPFLLDLQDNVLKEIRERTLSSLPSYMQPQSVLSIDHIPLTSNGKVHSAALIEIYQQSTKVLTSFQSPRDEIERVLLDIWHELLAVEGIGVTDNFFEIGGHSILGMRLFLAIEHHLGEKLPLSALITAPTIESLATLLRERGWFPQISSLVTLKASESDQSFFFIHPLSGDILCYSYIVQNIQNDLAIYGLQDRSFISTLPPAQSVEETAAYYLTEIKRVTASRPFSLFGYSSGAIISYEILRQAIEDGLQVEHVILMDPWPEHKSNTVLPQTSVNEDELLKRGCDHPAQLTAIFAKELAGRGIEATSEPTSVLNANEFRSRPERDQLQFILDEVKAVGGLHPNFTIEEAKKLSWMFRNNLQITETYQPQGVDFDFDVILTDNLGASFSEEAYLQMTKLTRGYIRKHFVAGDNVSTISPKRSFKVAKIIDQVTERNM